jgi:hypothetical protein
MNPEMATAARNKIDQVVVVLLLRQFPPKPKPLVRVAGGLSFVDQAFCLIRLTSSQHHQSIGHHFSVFHQATRLQLNDHGGYQKA